MDESTLHTLLKKGNEHRASDVLLKVGQPPAFRVRGDLHYLQGEQLSPNQTHALAELILRRSRYRGAVDDLREYDTSYSVAGLGRFRVNVYRQRGTLAIALRAIPPAVPGFDALLIPPVVQQLADLERGMVLVCGAAGNGKSTTLAALLAKINQSRRVHIVTIEDPVEYAHRDELASISQREVGIDTDSFSSGLRSALRQDPDVIMLGEIRDEETMDIALKAAETGHLLMSTLHTPDVARTIGRVLALSGPNTKDTRERFADNLRAIVAQRLLPRADEKGRVLACEVLIVTGTARETIRSPEGNVPLKDIMERGTHPYGMQTFEASLKELVRGGLITKEVARQAMG